MGLSSLMPSLDMSSMFLFTSLSGKILVFVVTFMFSS